MLIFPGGYIELHVDTNPKSNQGVVDYDAGPSEWLLTGERLMTFMVYLSSVEEGGNTAFPLLGVTVPPRQGSALFWHTVTSSGYQDQRMKHLGRILYTVQHIWGTNRYFTFQAVRWSSGTSGS